MSPPNRVAQALGTQTTGTPGPVTSPGGRTPPSMGPVQPKSPFGNMPVSTGSDECASSRMTSCGWVANSSAGWGTA